MPKATKEYGEVIRFRASAAEKAELARFAVTENVTESDVIRRLIRAGSGMPLPVASDNRAALGECGDQLRKIGVNLNQAVRAMNEGRVGYDAALLKALLLLNQAVLEQREIIAQMLKPTRQRRAASA